MTITNETSAVTLPGNGSATSFAYNFLIPYQADGVTPAVLAYTTNAAGVVDYLVLNTDYSITGVGQAAGGTVAYPLSGSPLASGATISILRDLNYVQTYNFTSTKVNGPQLTRALDTLEMQIQQLREQLSNVTTTLDIVPDPFEFSPLTNQELGAPVESNIETLTGWDAGVELVTSLVAPPGFTYKLGGVSQGSGTGRATVGMTAQILGTSSAAFSTTLAATLYAGTQGATWSVTTKDDTPPPPAGTIVSSVAGLNAALAAAVGGETISCTPGTYTGMVVPTGKTYTSAVIVTSTDLGNPAVIRNFTLTNISKLTFLNVDLQIWNTTGTAFWIIDSDNIIIDTCHVYGQSLDGDPSNDTGSALTIWNSTLVTVRDCEFEEMVTALALGKSSSFFTLTRCNIHLIREDGFKAAQVTNVTITDNWIHDLRPSAGHPDCVQFFTQGATSANTDITITGNLLQREGGPFFQGFFLGVETGYNFPYENVLIDDNMLSSVATNACRTNGAVGFTLSNTTFQTVIGDAAPCYPLIQYSDQVTVQNVRANVIGGLSTCTNVTQSGNVTTTSMTQAAADAAIAAWRVTHPNVPS